MEKTKLEVKVKEKSLDVNGKRVNLDESFFDARVINDISDNKDERALELRYREMEMDSLCDEAGKIDDFLTREGLTDRIDAYPCPDGEEYPTVALIGVYDVTIHR